MIRLNAVWHGAHCGARRLKKSAYKFERYNFGTKSISTNTRPCLVLRKHACGGTQTNKLVQIRQKGTGIISDDKISARTTMASRKKHIDKQIKGGRKKNSPEDVQYRINELEFLKDKSFIVIEFIASFYYSYKTLPMLFSTCLLYLKHNLGFLINRQDTGVITDRKRAMAVYTLNLYMYSILKYLPTLIFPPLLPILAYYLPKCVHRIYYEYEYHPLMKGLSRMNNSQMKNSGSIVDIYLSNLTKKRKNVDGSAQKQLNINRTNIMNGSVPIRLITDQIASNCTIDKLSYLQLWKIARFLNISMPYIAPMSRIYSWADWVLKCDATLCKSGARFMSYYELVNELTMRGYKLNIASKPPIESLISHLISHLDYTQSVFADLSTRSEYLKGLKSPHELSSIIYGPLPVTMSVASMLVLRAASTKIEYKDPNK